MSDIDATQWLLSKIEPHDSALSLSGRIYQNKAPKNKRGTVLIWQILGGDQEEVADSGPAEAGTLDLQLRYYASQAVKAAKGREALRLALQNIEPENFEGIRIEGTSFENAGDTFEKETEDHGALALVAVHWSKAASEGPE